jgi:hypothetical protein
VSHTLLLSVLNTVYVQADPFHVCSPGSGGECYSPANSLQATQLVQRSVSNAQTTLEKMDLSTTTEGAACMADLSLSLADLDSIEYCAKAQEYIANDVLVSSRDRVLLS